MNEKLQINCERVLKFHPCFDSAAQNICSKNKIFILHESFTISAKDKKLFHQYLSNIKFLTLKNGSLFKWMSNVYYQRLLLSLVKWSRYDTKKIKSFKAIILLKTMIDNKYIFFKR